MVVGYALGKAMRGATHHTPRPPTQRPWAAPQLLPRRHYLTVYSTVKGLAQGTIELEKMTKTGNFTHSHGRNG